MYIETTGFDGFFSSERLSQLETDEETLISELYQSTGGRARTVPVKKYLYNP